MTSPTTDGPGPAALRAELESMIIADLLGPSSPRESLLGVRSPVREWYLVGMLAPLGTIVDASRIDGDDDLIGQGDEATGPSGRPPKTVLFPSSAGLTFSVDPECPELEAIRRSTAVNAPRP